MSWRHLLSRFTLTLALAACLTSLAAAQAGGIEVFAGETLFAAGTRVSIAHLYESKTELFRGSDKVPNPDDRSRTEHRVVLGYNYGWRPRVTVGALLPVVAKQNDLVVGGVPTDRDASGLGDLALFGKYRLYTRDAYRTSTNVSLIAGLEVPTGATGETANGARIPANLQPGSGSWDPFAALAFTSSHGRWRYDAQAFYKWNTEGSQDFEASDVLALGIAAAYRYLHNPYPGSSNSARLGLIWREKGSARQGGSELANFGARELFLRPGLGFHPTPPIDLSLAIDLPLYRDYDGEQLGVGFRTFIAFGYRF